MSPLARLNAIAATRPLPPRAWDAIEVALARVLSEIEDYECRDQTAGRFQRIADGRRFRCAVLGGTA